jgi:hypothetical protein
MKNLSLKICLAIAALFANVGSGFAGSDLPACPSSGFKNGNCFGATNWTNGDKYVGEYKDGWFHGQGTLNYGNGEKYVGEWEYNRFHGQGIFYHRNGKVEGGV